MVFDVEPEDPVTVRVIVPMVNGNAVLSVVPDLHCFLPW